MQTLLNPYLSFNDNARQAMEFYHGVFGGKLEIHTFKEYGASTDPSEDDKVMHSMIQTDSGLTFMAADTPSGMTYQVGSNVSMSLSGDNEQELTGYFAKLSEGGTVTMPLEKSPWGDTFGMLVDKFGMSWMVDIGAPRQ
jgi:PhnB protein